MKNYYISYQYQNGSTNGFGCMSLEYKEFKSPGDIPVLANKIASLLGMKDNSVIILFFKEF